MIEEIPAEYELPEERDLCNMSKFLYYNIGKDNTFNIVKGKIYSANIIKSLLVKQSTHEEEVEYFKNLIGAGLTNVESFFAYALKHQGSSLVICAINDYLTYYTNSMFKYVCQSSISADAICAEYNDLAATAGTNVSCKYVQKVLNDTVKEFCAINQGKSIEDLIAIDRHAIHRDMLEFKYSIKLCFTYINFLDMNKYLKECKQRFEYPYIVFVMDKDHEQYLDFRTTIGDQIVNRFIMAYSDNDNIPNGGMCYRVFRTMDDKFIFTR